MMDIQTIIAMNKTRTNKAKRHGRQPATYNAAELATMSAQEICRKIPAMGDYVPKGWKKVEEHFVDASGFGAPGEPAMTIEAFAKMVKEKPSHGWGIGETGQFQCYIWEYVRR
jgi:hypothetical protein